MTVSVKFFSNIKKLMGRSEVTLRIDPSKPVKIRELLEEIGRQEDKALLPLLTDSEEVPLRAVRIVLNGRIIHSPRSYETPLQDGDKVAIFPLLAGG